MLFSVFLTKIAHNEDMLNLIQFFFIRRHGLASNCAHCVGARFRRAAASLAAIRVARERGLAVWRCAGI